MSEITTKNQVWGMDTYYYTPRNCIYTGVYMTTLYGIVGPSEVILFSDGFSRVVGTREKANSQIKTVRVNSGVALGFAGAVPLINEFLINIFAENHQRSAWEELITDGDTLAPEIEKASIERLFSLDDLKGLIDCGIKHMAQELGAALQEKGKSVSVFLGGRDAKGTRLVVWDTHESLNHVVNVSGSQESYQRVAPSADQKTDEKAERIWVKHTWKNVEEKIADIVKLWARKFPNDCNSQYSYRRLSQGFKLEPSVALTWLPEKSRLKE